MRHLLAGVVGFVLFLAFAAPSQAADACYAWDCNEITHVCTFDASCSTWAGSLWLFRWDFGDGSGFVYTASATIQHTFSISASNVELMVIPQRTASAAVSCEITVWNWVGPPFPVYGTCD